MAKHFRPYDFNLTAFGSQVIYATGKVAKILSATGSVSIRVDGGSAVPLAVGQGIWLDDGDSFQEITVQDTSGAINAGRLFIGAGQLIDQTFSGTINNFPVSVPDRIAQAALDAKLFVGSSYASAGIGQSCVSAIFNPVASGQVMDIVSAFTSGTHSSNHSVIRFSLTGGVAGIAFNEGTIGYNVGSSAMRFRAISNQAAQANNVDLLTLAGFTGPVVVNTMSWPFNSELSDGLEREVLGAFETSLGPGQGLAICTLSAGFAALHRISLKWIRK